MFLPLRQGPSDIKALALLEGPPGNVWFLYP